MFVKNELLPFVKIRETDSDYVFWLHFSNQSKNSENDFLLGVVYQPPEGSRFLKDDEKELLEVEITSMCVSYSRVVLVGYMNARTADAQDYTEADPFLFDYFDLDNELLEHFNQSNVYASCNLLQNRKSLDTQQNKSGENLLSVCKSNNLIILNGRSGNDAGIGKFTFKDCSVIDYAIVTTETAKHVQNFDIIKLDPIFSDGHSLVHFQILGHASPTQRKHKKSKYNKKWEENKKTEFCENLDQGKILNLQNEIYTKLNDIESVDNNDINNYVQQISDIFQNAAQKTFQTQNYFVSQNKNDKKWFGNECRVARYEYNKAKTKHNKNPNLINKQSLIEKSKIYKATMNKFINKEQVKTQENLQKLHSNKPKEFWKILNSLEKKSDNPDLDLNEFYEYFRNINSAENIEDDHEVDIDLHDNNDILNSQITDQEIMNCIKNLKNNKAFGNDIILNEYIKTTANQLLPIYTNLFNLIFETGIIPEIWLEGIIRPIYKGNAENPENYRPITILSCFSKLFTAVLNTRLTKYVTENEILEENQAGFRKGYSTSDQIFSLHALIEIMKARKMKLFCAFIDFRKAFDSVWRTGLWSQLIKTEIDGKFLRIIRNIYQGIKSCVSLNGQNSNFFYSNAGLRQGENLSPLLFSLFLNDLENFMIAHGCDGVDIDCVDEELVVYTQLLLLLYTDDTAILADNEESLQHNLDDFFKFCKALRLSINYAKTNILIFGVKNKESFHFQLDNNKIDIVDTFKYLGVTFSSSRSFLKARLHAVQQARKALCLLYKRIRYFNLPLKLQIKLFDHTIVPILLYGSEIWGFENTDLIEKLHNEFLRKITNLRKSTPIYMLHAELGRFPLEINIKVRMINFWLSIVTGKPSKFSYILYKCLLNDTDDGIYEHKWIKYIREILHSVGRSDVLEIRDFKNVNIAALKNSVIRTLKDQYMQNWETKLEKSSKGQHYRLLKHEMAFEGYLSKYTKKIYSPLLKFRTSNHKLPVERGRWEKKKHNECVCTICNRNMIGDEFHYVLECEAFKEERHALVKRYFYKHPNVLKYSELMNNSNDTIIRNLSKFVDLIMKKFENI